jgi:lysophospholipase L1-like esterase
LGLRRRVLLAAAGVPLVAAAVIGVEVELARRGENLPDVELAWADAGDVHAVWLGDSTAYGVGVTDGEDAVASIVARRRGERVTNLAVSGATLAEVVALQLGQVSSLGPDRIYVSVGANDVTHLTRTDDFFRDYRDLLGRLPVDAEVVVLGVPDMGAPPRLAQPLRAVAGWRGRRLDEEVQRAVRNRRDDADRFTYVDIAGETGPTFRENPDRTFAADGYHPSAAGYRVWADAVLEGVGA